MTKVRDDSPQIVVVTFQVRYNMISLHRLPEYIRDVSQTSPASKTKDEAVVKHTQSFAGSFVLVKYLDCVQEVSSNQVIGSGQVQLVDHGRTESRVRRHCFIQNILWLQLSQDLSEGVFWEPSYKVQIIVTCGAKHIDQTTIVFA